MKVIKGLNNNVVIAEHEEYGEVILTGRGIGFSKRPGDLIDDKTPEKFFILKNENEQTQYRQLIEHIDETFIACITEILQVLEAEWAETFEEHIHVALTDHVSFALERTKKGLTISNPFLKETQLAYEKEYRAAGWIIDEIEQWTGVRLPEEEKGFIALHLHGAVTRTPLDQVNAYTRLVKDMTVMVERALDIQLSPEDLDHRRLFRHLQQAVARVRNGEFEEASEPLKKMLQAEYPFCYNLSWKLIRTMQRALQTTIPEGEAVYLTIHLQRLSSKRKY